MPLILSADCASCANRNDRLEMEMVAQVQGLPPQRYCFNVSYKKHAISSYKTNWSPPPTAEVNTLVNMSEGDFMAAFNQYGRLLAVKLEHKDNVTFNPSAPANRILTAGIAFSSDAQNLGGNVHCFPFNISPAQTPRCISLSGTAFNNFKIVAQFLYRTGGVQQAAARTSWAAIETLVRNRPNELFSAAEIQTLAVRLQEGGALQGLLTTERGAISKAQNLGKRPNPDPNRRPFRSNG